MLVELVLLSATRLMAVAFLYVLGTRISVSGPPTWDVVQEALDQLIQFAIRLPDLMH
jgi:hypothetical protein